MNRCLAIIVAMLLSWPGQTLAIDATELQQMSEGMSLGYMSGVTDTLQTVASLLEFAPKTSASLLIELGRCINQRQMRYGQIEAIAQKYMKNNPEQWDSPGSLNVWFALNEACKK